MEKEIQEYLEQSRIALEEYEWQEKLPKRMKKEVAFPEVPETLQWLMKVETWGLPNPGTFLDQPHRFMEDMDVAKQTRDAYRSKQAGITYTDVPDIDNFDATFQGAPDAVALTTRAG